ncbi:MAG: NfeD family protein [Myxococcota bacterium]
MLMMVYIGALVFGGVLLGSSILLGGHDDADLDADGDLDVDADADVEVDKSIDFSGDGADVLWIFKSLRFWTFFLAFFGLTGVLLDGLGLVASQAVTLVLALAMGGGLGVLAAGVIRALSRDETSEAAGEADYIGKSAQVVVPIRKGGVGKVRVEVKGQQVDLLAEADEEIGSADEVLVVEMDGTRARVARVDD